MLLPQLSQWPTPCVWNHPSLDSHFSHLSTSRSRLSVLISTES